MDSPSYSGARAFWYLVDKVNASISVGLGLGYVILGRNEFVFEGRAAIGIFKPTDLRQRTHYCPQPADILHARQTHLVEAPELQQDRWSTF